MLNLVGPFLGLMMVIAVFTVLTGKPETYLSADNLKSIVVQSTIIATCGIGMTLVIISGGIDLSVGSALALSTVTVGLVFNGEFYDALDDTIHKPVLATLFGGRAWVMWLVIGALVAWTLRGALASRRARKEWLIAVTVVAIAGWFVFGGKGAIAAVIAGALMGMACGFVNGLLVTKTRVVPFIITLGTMEIFRGGAQWIARGESVNVDDKMLTETYGWLDRLMSSNPRPPWLIIAPGAWVMIVAGILSAILLSRTRLGRYIFAIGSNEQAAVLSGIAVERVKLWVYGLAGLIAGLAGVMQFSRLSYGSSTAGSGLELDVIAAVVIGGGSLRGGEGSIVGTFVGAAIMGFMRSGCTLARIPSPVQRVLIGAIIVLAVAVDEFRHRRKR